MSENIIEGRNSVLEALRSDKTVEKLYIQEKLRDGSIQSILREAKKKELILNFVSKERLDQLSPGSKHQGVIARVSDYKYVDLEDILESVKESGRDALVFILDGIEDPHNLGAIIRTANQVGAHGIIIPKNRAVGLTSSVARASAGAINFVKVAKVTNLARTIDTLRDRGFWFVCADMSGELMYKQDLKGNIALIIGNEGRGVGELLKKKCDYIAKIPMYGDIDSLNVSVATAVLAYEVIRQRNFS